MNNMIRIETNNGKASLFTPYNPDFVKAVKKIGGAAWDGKEKCWTVPEAQVPAARFIMEEIYGYSDKIPNEPVTVLVTFHDDVWEQREDLVLFGKILAHAYERDSGAKPGEDVAYIQGDITSGGSRKNWLSIVKKGSIAILTNVNRTVYEREKAYLSPYIETEVMETKPDKAMLLEEKEFLLKQIADIDRMLQEA